MGKRRLEKWRSTCFQKQRSRVDWSELSFYKPLPTTFGKSRLTILALDDGRMVAVLVLSVVSASADHDISWLSVKVSQQVLAASLRLSWQRDRRDLIDEQIACAHLVLDTM